MDEEPEYSDEEVAVLADSRRLWVRGVRPGTTCADIVAALLPTCDNKKDGEWTLAERWRGVERPLPADACVLDVLSAWGDARDEVRLSLRCASGGEDSGRDSPSSTAARRGRSRRRPARRARSPPHAPAAKLVTVIQHQTRTIHQQLDKLRDQEKQIDRLEDQTHKSRMEKHGTNYLLESYLRDLGRSAEITDSQAGNSDSGVGGGSGTPPRRQTKHKSRRERHLMREHYFTKELTDICQINADRINHDTDSDASTDELAKMREEIELLEKIAIINKRLHREEELILRLNAKVKRYTDENNVNSCENTTQINVLLNRLSEEFNQTSKEMEKNAEEIEKANVDIEEKVKELEELTLELEQEELQNQLLERELYESSKRQPIVLDENYVSILDGVPEDVTVKPGLQYTLDTLV